VTHCIKDQSREGRKDERRPISIIFFEAARGFWTGETCLGERERGGGGKNQKSTPHLSRYTEGKTAEDRKKP